MMSLSIVNSQITQSIKGKILDKESQAGLPGVNIVVSGSNPLIGTITDETGNFVLNNISVGRHSLNISYVGYDPVTINSLPVTSGKEVFLEVELKESFNQLNEVVIKAHQKDKPLNSMAMISARTFSVEETHMFAGGLDDPGRLVSVYAGVADGNVESNGIIVRGNSPIGVVYRVEGVEVDNPNHFAGEDFLGGGFVSIINSHVLANSDFLTGAFPAEYGNALSAVFDINFRTGNPDKYEHAIQVGVLGIDFSSEGPIIRKTRASYLFNYRYSTFGLIKPFLPKGEGLPVYQDFSFKINVPSKIGIFSVWGSGGIENYTYGNLKDTVFKDNIVRNFINDNTGTGFIGIKHKKIINSSAYINTSFLANSSFKSNNQKQQQENGLLIQKEKIENVVWKYVFTSFINKKFSVRHVNRTGFNYSLMFNDFNSTFANENTGISEKISDTRNNSGLINFYSQSKIKLLKDLEVNCGFNFQYFTLNDKYLIEPRTGISWNINRNNRLSMGFGMHSQIQPLNVYFIEKEENGIKYYPNKNLGYTRSNHFVLGYDHKFSSNLLFKVEPFLQFLSDVPVIDDSSFSVINLTDLNTFNEVLVNNGKGRNIGVDFTVERFFDEGYYFLLTLSVFDSRYKGGDGVERNTRFNKNYVGNVLGGKEFKINKNNYLSVNGRLYLNGGDRTSPFNNEASLLRREVVYDDSQLFKSKNPFTYRFDLSLSYTVNKNSYSNIFSAQVMNVLGSVIMYEDSYNKNKNLPETLVYRNVLPSLSWKIVF